MNARVLLLSAGLCLVTAQLEAQEVNAAARTGSSTAPPALGAANVPAGKEASDSKGRRIENTGTNGSVTICYTGTLRWDTAGNATCTGEILQVENRATIGSASASINTNGEPTTINLDQNGQHTYVIDGGRATVNCNGDRNNVIVGGLDNNVNLNGNDISGSGANAHSGGTATMGRRSSGNSWRSNGGNWTVRN